MCTDLEERVVGSTGHPAVPGSLQMTRAMATATASVLLELAAHNARHMQTGQGTTEVFAGAAGKPVCGAGFSGSDAVLRPVSLGAQLCPLAHAVHAYLLSSP